MTVPVQSIPEQLKRAPFTVAYAEHLGFSRHRLRGRNWRRLAYATYVWAGLKVDPHAELIALISRLPRDCVVSGLTAARLHGIDIDGAGSVEITAPPAVSVRVRPGLSVRNAVVEPADVTSRGSVRVTTPVRTCFDLARSLPMMEAVAAVDKALHLKLVTLDQLHEYVERRAGCRGVPQARRVIDLAEPDAESPMESRLRMILVLGGLPRPKVGVELRDAEGAFLGRPDLLYPDARLGIEYDGSTHRDSLVSDNRRQNRLLRAGYLLLRYTGPDVYHRPQQIVEEVRTQLTSRGS
jgi:hypothetical protein